MGDADGILTSLAWADVAVTRNDDIIAILLICLVVFVGVSALIVRRVVRAELRLKNQLRQAPPVPVIAPLSPAALVEPPLRWLAVRATSIPFVQSALELQNARACVWSDVLVPPFEPRLFIAPPVRGWILILGSDLPDPADDVDQCFLFLARLSQKLGEVQFFVRNRAVSHHGWMRLDCGRVLRAYMWAGETLWNQGTLTAAERELKMHCLSYGENAVMLSFAEREGLSVNTERVSRLAGEWGVDPTAIEAEALEAKGIAGDLLHSKLH
jgi:hypothetical protein